MQMNLGELLDRLPEASVSGDQRTPVSGITFDSRLASTGMLFVALRGSYTDGHRYLRDAHAAGAVAALVEPDTPWELLRGYRATVRVKNTRAALAQVATSWYDQPSRDLTLIGVTGTDGKTTTCYFIEAVLAANDISTGLISTVAVRTLAAPEQRVAIRQTTPESLVIQRYLAEMRAAGGQAAVLETTSHGLEMHRVDGCLFDVGVVTNVTHEHIDFHGSVERYRGAKAGLLRRVAAAHAYGKRGLCVLNLDDEGTRSIASAATATEVFWFSPAGNKKAHLWVDEIKANTGAAGFRLHSPAGVTPVELKIAGSWNVANALAAAAVGHGLGLSLEQIAHGLATLQAVPGRMERVELGQPFTVLVDYAHTPLGLRAVLHEARRMTRKRVLTLIGSAGERDLAKRAMLGAAAQELSNYAIFTSDDPRFEDPRNIIGMMAAGAQQSGGVHDKDFACIVDRRDAIFELLDRARPGDVVVVAGKGHERSQIIGDTPYPWDDAAVAREALLQTAHNWPQHQ